MYNGEYKNPRLWTVNQSLHTPCEMQIKILGANNKLILFKIL